MNLTDVIAIIKSKCTFNSTRRVIYVIKLGGVIMEKERKNKKIILIILLIAILLLSIGFAAFNAHLKIQSSATVSPDPESFKVV